MLGTCFYNDIIRTVTAVFGTLFNDISIKRLNASGSATSVQKVPLRYAPKQKWYSRVFENASDTVKGDFAAKLPTMGFELTSIRLQFLHEFKLPIYFTNKINKIH